MGWLSVLPLVCWNLEIWSSCLSCVSVLGLKRMNALLSNEPSLFFNPAWLLMCKTNKRKRMGCFIMLKHREHSCQSMNDIDYSAGPGQQSGGQTICRLHVVLCNRSACVSTLFLCLLKIAEYRERALHGQPSAKPPRLARSRGSCRAKYQDRDWSQEKRVVSFQRAAWRGGWHHTSCRFLAKPVLYVF